VVAAWQRYAGIRGFCRLVWHSAAWQREEIKKAVFSTGANSFILKASYREMRPVKLHLE